MKFITYLAKLLGGQKCLDFPESAYFKIAKCLAKLEGENKCFGGVAEISF